MLEMQSSDIRDIDIKCPKKHHIYEVNSNIIEDNYHWLRDDNWPDVNEEVLAYLKEENAHAEKIAKNFSDIEQQLFEQMKARVIEEDISYPVIYYYHENKYSYYHRVVTNKEHKLYCRKKNDGVEEVILDVNILAGENKAFSLGDFSVSHDHSKIVYSEDHSGKERFAIKVKDLVSGELSDFSIEDTIGGIIWNRDSTGFYYIKLDDQWRGNMIYYHHLGSDNDDVLIYKEEDDTYHLSINESSEEDYLIININCREHNEVRVINLRHAWPNKESLGMQIVIPRERKILYEIDYHNSQLYMMTNDRGQNFRLLKKEGDIFNEIIPHSSSEYLTEIFFIADHLIVTKKIMGLNKIFIYKDDVMVDEIKFDQEPYEVKAIYTNKDDKFLRINYESLSLPFKTLEYDFSERKLYQRKILAIPNYSPENYESKRIWVKSSDGQSIPVSMVYRKDTKLHNAPMLLYGYGSYGISIPTNFSISRSVLLDKGFVYAIAHIRGGDELGFDWYKQAKFLNKKITFDDFASVIKYFLAESITKASKLSIMGGSAGGMLVAYMLNNYPNLFNSALALVPFVDVLNTMLDETLPLTPGEFEEWGNPKDKKYFDYIKSYCPYSNIAKQDYPNILVTAGINDPRVTYWEPAKFVAKLREMKTNNNLLLFKTELEQGHKGQYGKYNAIREMAYYYAFLIYSSEFER